MLHDRLAVGCCSLDVLVELLNVCLELLDPGSLRGVGLRRRVTRCRRELRLELAHTIRERVTCLLADAELAGRVVETRGEIRDPRLLRVGNLSGWVGHLHDRCGHERRAVGRWRRIQRNHAERYGLALTVCLLRRLAVVLSLGSRAGRARSRDRRRTPCAGRR